MALTKVDDRGLKTPIDLLDNEKIRLGTGNDIELYHSGSHSFLKNSTGDLIVNAASFYINNAAQTETMLSAVENGAVTLKYDNSTKFETISGGAQVTGTLNHLGGSYTNGSGGYVKITHDSGKFTAGASDDLEIYHDGTNTYLDNNTGQFNIDAASGNGIRFLVDGVYQCQVYTSGIDLPDNKKLRLGDSEDLQIYHDSSTPQNLINSYTSTPLTIMSNGDTSIKSNNGDNMGVFKKDGAVELYYDNAKKLETTSTGVTVTGNITAAKLLSSQSSGSAGLSFGDGVQINLGSGDDTRVYHNGADLYIDNDTGGTWIGLDSGATFGVGTGPAASPQALKAVIGAQVELMHNGTKKFETTSSGIDVAGSVDISGAGTLVSTGSTYQPLTFKNNGRTGTYNQSCMYAHQNNTSGNSNNGIVFEVGRLTDSSSAEIGKFTIATRGGNIATITDADGIKFNGDTAAANALDDYEYGEWTPVLQAYDYNNSNDWTNVSYDNALDYTSGRYIKIGCMVYVWWYSGNFSLDSGYNTLSARIDGLPYVFINNDPYYGGNFSFTHTNCFKDTSNNLTGIYSGYGRYNATFFYPNIGNSTSNARWGSEADRYMMVSGVYQTNV